MKLQLFATMLFCTLITTASSYDASVCLYNTYLEQPIILPKQSIIENVLKEHFLLLDEDNRYSFLSEQLAYRHFNDATELLQLLEIIVVPWIVPIHQKITIEVIHALIQESRKAETVEDEQEDEDEDELSEKMERLQIRSSQRVPKRIVRKRR